MDLTQGLISMNAPIANIDAAGSYATGESNALAINKAKMENENALYQQKLTTKLQNAINASVNKDGSLNYDLLAKKGAEYGVAPQMIDYMIKTLPAQWSSLAQTAQAKQQFNMQSPAGYGAAQNEVNTNGQSATQGTPNTNRQQAAPVQSSSQAAAVPGEKASWADQPAIGNDASNGDDTKANYAYLTPDEKYSSDFPIKDVNATVVNAGSPEDLDAQTGNDSTGFFTSDMLVPKNSAFTDFGNVTVDDGKRSADKLNQNYLKSNALNPDTTTDTAQDTSGLDASNAGNANQADQQMGTNLFDIGNKAPIRDFASMIMGGKTGQKGSTDYFQVQSGATSSEIKTIVTDLQRNANLGPITPDNDGKYSDADIAKINAVLKAQQDKDINAVGPAPILMPDKDGKYDYNDYAKRMQEWQKGLASVSAQWSEKYGKAYGEQLTQQLQTEANDRANQQLQNDVVKYNNDVNGRNAYAKEISKTLNLGETLNAATFQDLKSMQDFAFQASAYKKLLGTHPTTAFQVLGWAKNYIQAEGLGEAEGTMKLIQLMAAKDPAIRAEIAATYGGDWKAIGMQEVANWLSEANPGTLSELINEMKFTLDWKSHTGGTGLTPMSGKASKTDPAKPGTDNPAPNPAPNAVTSFPKSGWYDQPIKPGERAGFTSASGKRYGLDYPGTTTNKFGETTNNPYTSAYDASGKKYELKPNANGGIDIIDPNAPDNTPDKAPSAIKKKSWSKQPAKAPSKPKVGEMRGDKIWTGMKWI